MDHNTSTVRVNTMSSMERFDLGRFALYSAGLYIAYYFSKVVYRLYFHPARLHMPKWFLQDCAERYFEGKRVYKVIQASSDPFGQEEGKPGIKF